MLHVVALVLALAAAADTDAARVATVREAAPVTGTVAGPAAVAEATPASVLRLGTPRFPAVSWPLAEPGATAPGAADGPEAATSPEPLAADTPVARRPQAVEYSDWYARRLVVHRIASYAMVPLFVGQWITGSQLMAKGAAAPQWAIRTHGPMATAMLGLFSVNTVTGGWNLWEARKDPEGRTPRMLHGVLMLVADAGFLVTGALQKPAENSSSIRSLHRTLAFSSIGVSMVSWAIMLPPFRR